MNNTRLHTRGWGEYTLCVISLNYVFFPPHDEHTAWKIWCGSEFGRELTSAEGLCVTHCCMCNTHDCVCVCRIVLCVSVCSVVPFVVYGCCVLVCVAEGRGWVRELGLWWARHKGNQRQRLKTKDTRTSGIFEIPGTAFFAQQEQFLSLQA